jgi:hypothetical protein
MTISFRRVVRGLWLLIVVPLFFGVVLSCSVAMILTGGVPQEPSVVAVVGVLGIALPFVAGISMSVAYLLELLYTLWKTDAHITIGGAKKSIPEAKVLNE